MARTVRRLEPLEHAAGADHTVNIPLYDSAGDALDPTGHTASWSLYRAVPRRGRRPFRGASVLTKTSAAGEITLSSGNAAVVIADTDLANSSGDYWQELKLTDGSGVVSIHGQGPVLLRAALV